jgi:nitrogen-specific signal transduction histidine kinase
MDGAMSDLDHASESSCDELLHDVRNRLTVIKGVAQLLDRQVQRDDWQREKIVARVDRLQDEIAHLERLVDSTDSSF